KLTVLNGSSPLKRTEKSAQSVLVYAQQWRNDTEQLPHAVQRQNDAEQPFPTLCNDKMTPSGDDL
ncbi:MAG: hypothetical protein DRI32_00205, partial [Chloroflexi bacterium]